MVRLDSVDLRSRFGFGYDVCYFVDELVGDSVFGVDFRRSPLDLNVSRVDLFVFDSDVEPFVGAWFLNDSVVLE